MVDDDLEVDDIEDEDLDDTDGEEPLTEMEQLEELAQMGRDALDSPYYKQVAGEAHAEIEKYQKELMAMLTTNQGPEGGTLEEKQVAERVLAEKIRFIYRCIIAPPHEWIHRLKEVKENKRRVEEQRHAGEA